MAGLGPGGTGGSLVLVAVAGLGCGDVVAGLGCGDGVVADLGRGDLAGYPIVASPGPVDVSAIVALLKGKV